MLKSRGAQLEDFLVSQDMYGYAIGVNYRGSGSYQTRVGAFFTLVTYVLMIINFSSLSEAFASGSKQEEKAQTVQQDIYYSDPYNLQENGVSLYYAIDPPIPSNIARMQTYQMSGRRNYTKVANRACEGERYEN